jgi:hypothetical protein
MEGRPSDLTRRELLKAAGAAAVTVPLVTGNALVAAAVTSAAAPLFFTREQFAMVDELTEIVIPTDEHSGGARAAGVAAYIDGRLAEAVEPERKQRWIEGLARVDALAHEQKGAAFMQLSPDDRLAVVTTMAADEEKRTTVEGKFFSELKRQTARGYYTSKIGLHDELEYKGNVLQEEYSGIDVSKL